MKYDLAIFDLDGTILDTIQDLTNAVNHTLELFEMPIRTTDEIASFLGNGSKHLIKESAPTGVNNEILTKLHNEYSIYYKEHCSIKTAPYIGIIEVLKKLRAANIKTAVISNKPDYGVQILCKEHFDGLFDIVLGEKTNIPKKPSPESVNLVVKELNSTNDKTIYIGDSEVDIQTAKNAGTSCISVTWGFRNESFLLENGAKLIARKPMDILNIIIQKDKHN